MVCDGICNNISSYGCIIICHRRYEHQRLVRFINQSFLFFRVIYRPYNERKGDLYYDKKIHYL
nr:MAG TPA: hypothetical protein [Caudoviricetes sp.]DAR69142.1 MAG TPA: hypothetical protein [Caudoviricetes sp.]